MIVVEHIISDCVFVFIMIINKVSTARYLLIIASITIKVAYDHTRTVYTGVGVRRVL
jgi:hypothetical protein